MHNKEQPQDEESWPALPTETEIYILPNGEIVIADLPAELAAAITPLINQQQTTGSATESITEQISDHAEPGPINT